MGSSKKVTSRRPAQAGDELSGVKRRQEAVSDSDGDTELLRPFKARRLTVDSEHQQVNEDEASEDLADLIDDGAEDFLDDEVYDQSEDEEGREDEDNDEEDVVLEDMDDSGYFEGQVDTEVSTETSSDLEQSGAEDLSESSYIPSYHADDNSLLPLAAR